MAFALGCDFCPQGIPGLGKETLRGLLDLWPLDWDPILILQMWHDQGFQGTTDKPPKKGSSYECYGCSSLRHCDDCLMWREKVFAEEDKISECHCHHLAEKPDLLKLETTFKKRCKQVGENDSLWTLELTKILDEFQGSKELAARKGKKNNRKKVSLSESDMENLPSRMVIQCPKVADFVSMAVTKLGWTEEYAVEKIIPVVTRWQIGQCSVAANTSQQKILLEVDKILKKRTVGGVASLALQWKPVCTDLIRLFPETETEAPLTVESTEPYHLVEQHCPDLLSAFEDSKQKKKPAAGATRKRRKDRKPEQESGPDNNSAKPITQFFQPVKKSDAAVATASAAAVTRKPLEPVDPVQLLRQPMKAAASPVHKLRQTAALPGTPVSSSDLYRRIFLDSPSQSSTPYYPSKVRHFDESKVCSVPVFDESNVCSVLGDQSDFVGDLSVIIDDIISNNDQKQEQNAVSSDVKNAAESGFCDVKNSTAIGAVHNFGATKILPSSPPKIPLSKASTKTTTSWKPDDVSPEASFEDSFDRMCK